MLAEQLDDVRQVALQFLLRFRRPRLESRRLALRQTNLVAFLQQGIELFNTAGKILRSAILELHCLVLKRQPWYRLAVAMGLCSRLAAAGLLHTSYYRSFGLP